MSLARFTELWTSVDYPPEPVAQVDLERAEERLGVQLPIDYKRAVLQTGLPRTTIALLDAIVERDLDLASVGDFYSPEQTVEQTLAWRKLGMPQHMIAFASDDCGNMFCFDAKQLSKPVGGGRAIWFFDHDFGTVEEIAPSFDDWMGLLCEVQPTP